MTEQKAGRLFPPVVDADRPALSVGDVTLSHRDLGVAMARHSERLASLGVAPGDRVAVWTERVLETPVALLGNAAYGVVSVPLNSALGARELDHLLTDSDPSLILATTAASASRTPERKVASVVVEIDGEGAAATVAADDRPILILYTSGTTGPPKGAVLTAKNAAANLDGLAAAWGWTALDTVVHALPLFHVHGLVLGLFGSLRIGAHLRWVPRFTPEAVAEALCASGTMLFAVPTMYRRLADAAESDAGVAAALRQTRLLVSGSAGLPIREHRRIEALTGHAIVERYGLTETLINTAVRHDAPRPGHVGPAVTGVELRLVDDARRPLDAGDGTTIGEVAVRGPSVFAGYLNRPDATAKVRDDEGWFYTGDLATMTHDGFVRIVGRRATDMIKTGGFKVGAGEVEAALLEEPGVAEAAVIGVPDDDLGQRIVAYVVPTDATAPPDPGALSRAVAEGLAPHKRPREVHYLDALPRNAMGKIQKKRLSAPPKNDDV